MSRNVPGIMSPVVKQLTAALLGAALLLAANFLPIATSAAADKPDDKPKISAAAGKPLKAAQDALEKQDYPSALTHLKEAEALPNKTDFDEYTLNQMYLFYYSRTNDLADAEKVLENVVGSPYMDKADMPARLRTLAQMNYQAKDYDKAIQYGERAIKEGNPNDDVYTIVDQAYYLKGDYANALRAINVHLDVATKAGQPPNEALLKLALSTCLKLNDNDCTTHALDRRVAAYPTPDNWRELLYTIIQTPGQTDPYLLQVYRLAFDVDVLKGPEDYMEMATLANDQGSPGEAQRVLEAGRQKNVFSTPALKTHSAQLLESVKKKVEIDQASLPKIAADAQTAKTGTKDVALGLAYFSYQQYDKAAEALTNGLAKGGLKNEADARLILGIAQLHAGKKDDAQKTFDQVKGDPKLERLAHLWQSRAHQA
jgi:tetratricopeptide (TPR) repeat protein